MLPSLNLLSASELGSLPAWLQTATVVALTAVVTFGAGLVIGRLFPNTGPDDPKKQPARILAAPYRLFRVLSGPTASFVGGLVGVFLGGKYGLFTGVPCFGLGFGIGLTLQQDNSWTYWRATFLAGWIGSWISGILIQSTIGQLPAADLLRWNLGGTALASLPVIVYSAFIGLVLSFLTTAPPGSWTVVVISDADTAEAGTVAGAIWVIVLVGAAVTLRAIPSFETIARSVVGPAAAASTAQVGAASSVSLGALLSLFAAVCILPYATTRVKGEGETSEAVTNVPKTITPFWRIVPGAFLGIVFGLTVLVGFVLGTGTRIPSRTDLLWVVLGSALVGMVFNGVFTGTPRTPESTGGEKNRRTAFFQTVGGLLYGTVAGVSAWGLLYFAARFTMAMLSATWFVTGLAMGVVAAACLIVPFLVVERRASRTT